MMASLLIIEDETNLRRFLAANLWARGYSISEASTAQEGLDELRLTRIDAVLLDIYLPDMNGWSFLRVMQNHDRWREIPVIVITASSDYAVGAKESYANVICKLRKPIGVTELVAAVGLTGLQGDSVAAQ